MQSAVKCLWLVAGCNEVSCQLPKFFATRPAVQPAGRFFLENFPAHIATEVTGFSSQTICGNRTVTECDNR